MRTKIKPETEQKRYNKYDWPKVFHIVSIADQNERKSGGLSSCIGQYKKPAIAGFPVRGRGLEPPRPCERYHLKVVRLPVSPPAHVPILYLKKYNLATKNPAFAGFLLCCNFFFLFFYLWFFWSRNDFHLHSLLHFLNRLSSYEVELRSSCL